MLKGFIVGLSLTILAGQVPRLFGIEPGTGDFFERVWDFLINIDQTDGLTLLVGIGSLAVLFGFPRVVPAIPGTLAAVVLGIGAVEIFDLGAHGVAIVGSIDSGLPSLALPDVSLDRFGGLAAAALGVMLVGFAESLGTAKTYAQRENREIDPNRELIGLGAANLGAGVSGGFVVNGSLSKTAVNSTAGGRTQLVGLIAAGLTMLTLLFLTGYFESLPVATLAAVVIAALIDLIDFSALRDFYRVYSGRLGRGLRLRGSGGLHRSGRRDARGDDLRHPGGVVHRGVDLAAAPPLPRLTATGGRARESPRGKRSLLGSRSASGEPARRGHRRVEDRGRVVLRQCRAGRSRRSAARQDAMTFTRWSSTRRRCRSSTSRRPRSSIRSRESYRRTASDW